MAGSSFASLARRAARNETSVAVDKLMDGLPPLAIHRLGDAVLREPAQRVSRVDASTRDLCRNMLRSMYAADGIGLAAPQVGVNQQVLVIDLDPETPSTPPMVLINPHIKSFGSSCDTYEEGCLSIPGVYLDVVRPTWVEASFLDERGHRRRLKADGLLGRCIQHEIDHLNGVLFVDRVRDTDALHKKLVAQGFEVAAVDSIPWNKPCQ